MKKICLMLCSVLLIVTGCNQEIVEEDMLNLNYEIKGNASEINGYNTTNPIVAMHIEGYGSIVMELYPEIAPNTVNNFISLVESGFYDNNTFHRLIEGFVLQGGDPDGNGTGGPGYSIPGEFTSNGFSNTLKHEIGILSMARSMDPDSAGSQFFIMIGDAAHLDGEYASFGKVIDGMDNIERLVATEKVVDTNGTMANNLVLKKAIVDLNNYTPTDVVKIMD